MFTIESQVGTGTVTGTAQASSDDPSPASNNAQRSRVIVADANALEQSEADALASRPGGGTNVTEGVLADTDRLSSLIASNGDGFSSAVLESIGASLEVLQIVRAIERDAMRPPGDGDDDSFVSPDLDALAATIVARWQTAFGELLGDLFGVSANSLRPLVLAILRSIEIEDAEAQAALLAGLTLNEVAQLLSLEVIPQAGPFDRLAFGVALDTGVEFLSLPANPLADGVEPTAVRGSLPTSGGAPTGVGLASRSTEPGRVELLLSGSLAGSPALWSRTLEFVPASNGGASLAAQSDFELLGMLSFELADPQGLAALGDTAFVVPFASSTIYAVDLSDTAGGEELALAAGYTVLPSEEWLELPSDFLFDVDSLAADPANNRLYVVASGGVSDFAGGDAGAIALEIDTQSFAITGVFEDLAAGRSELYFSGAGFVDGLLVLEGSLDGDEQLTNGFAMAIDVGSGLIGPEAVVAFDNFGGAPGVGLAGPALGSASARPVSADLIKAPAMIARGSRQFEDRLALSPIFVRNPDPTMPASLRRLGYTKDVLDGSNFIEGLVVNHVARDTYLPSQCRLALFNMAIDSDSDLQAAFQAFAGVEFGIGLASSATREAAVDLPDCSSY